MNEQKEMKKKLIKNTIINFVIFFILFIIFDLIIYNQMSMSLYKDIDKELLKGQEKYLKIINENLEENIQENNIDTGKKNLLNPRLVYIIRDEAGTIINKEEIGNIYKEYEDSIYFDSDNLMQTYTIKLEEEYTYRGINFKVEADGQTMYIQLLANVDGETKTLNNMLKILLIGTVVVITISIIASYILSRKMVKPLYQAYQKQTEFVENVSHELRTPLTIIHTKQELLLQEPESKIIDKSEDINLTLKETRRLTKMIKELMCLARADYNDYKLEKEKTNIDELIKETVKPYQEYANLEEKNIILDLKYEKEINIDRNKITELMVILLDNAIKYTAKGDTITIKTYQKDGKCNIEVQDTGIGISDEGLKKIFNRFYREDKARSRATGGTGLGLSIASTIVLSHKGTIKAMHNKPKGTIILVKI